MLLGGAFGIQAAKLLAELRFPMDKELSSLDQKAIVQLAHLMREVQFDDPPVDCLGPVGEYNLRLGIIKELKPDMVATYQDAGPPPRPATAREGARPPKKRTHVRQPEPSR